MDVLTPHLAGLLRFDMGFDVELSCLRQRGGLGLISIQVAFYVECVELPSIREARWMPRMP